MSVMRFRWVILAVLFSAIVAAGAANAQTASQAPPLRSPDVIFVPTPPEVVDGMLKLAKVGPNDVVYDLGSGDGRIPIAAVQTFKARSAVGDRKSTRLNSSHLVISYAVVCLKKK